jgi:hypothetical protein
LVEQTVTRVKPLLLFFFLLGLALYFGVFVVGGAASGGTIALSLIGPAFLALGGIFIQSRPSGLKTLGALILGASITFNIMSLPAEHFTLGATFYGLQVAAALVLGRLRRLTTFKSVELVEVPVRVDAASLHSSPEQRIFGQPGTVASAVDKFGQHAVDAGVKGEQNTAELLKLLMKIPGTTVYHGLRFPNSANADVDHAVAHGNTVFLIDSKMFRWGDYEWQCGSEGTDEIVRTDGYGRPYKNNMHAAAEGYKEILGPGVNVMPLILMHGNKVGVGKNRTSCEGVMMLTANDAMMCIGDTLSESMPQWRDNQEVRGRLIKSLK